MIRFIDIRGQGTGNRFAFWDTVKNQFLWFCGEQAWNNWDEFLEVAGDDGEIERFKGISPRWIFDGGEDDIEEFYDA